MRDERRVLELKHLHDKFDIERAAGGPLDVGEATLPRSSSLAASRISSFRHLATLAGEATAAIICATTCSASGSPKTGRA